MHYQWLPFYVFSLAILYYFPYLISKELNGDLISLVNVVKTPSTRHAEKVVQGYFNYKVSSKYELWISTITGFFLQVNVIIVDNSTASIGNSWLTASDNSYRNSSVSLNHWAREKLEGDRDNNSPHYSSLFHRIRASATCYFLFNLQGKNAQICADFPSLKTLRKTNFSNHPKWLGNLRNVFYYRCLC